MHFSGLRLFETGSCPSGAEVRRVHDLAAPGLKVLDEVVAELLESWDVGGAVAKQNQLSPFAGAGGVEQAVELPVQVPAGVGQTVRQGLPAEDDDVGFLQQANEVNVHLRTGVLRIGDLGLDCGVVFGPGIGALGDHVELTDGRHFPALQFLENTLVDVVAPAALQTVFGPDDVRVASPGLELLRVIVKPAGHLVGQAQPDLADVSRVDHGERRRVVSGRGVDEGTGMGHVQDVVSVHGHVNVVQPVAHTADELRQPAHIVVGTGNGQGPGLTRSVDEIVLGIDDHQVNAGVGHDVPSGGLW